MVKFSHFKVEVLQDGAAAREYADPAAGESLDTETKYIEIQERKKLVIRLTVHEHFQFEEYDALCVEVRVDGEYAGGICYHQFSLVEDSENVKLIEGIPYTSDGKTCLRTFRFEEAEMRPLKKDEELDEVLEKYEDQGSIVIEIIRVCGVSSSEETTYGGDKSPENVPRKVVKETGCYTKTSFDVIEKDEPSYVFLRHDEEETATRFRLKYRTIEALTDLGIVDPRIIEHPVETIVIRDDDELTAENERLRKELEEVKKRVKIEAAEDHKERRQRKRKRLETATAGDGEVTDERPAKRRLPNVGDEVISLED